MLFHFTPADFFKPYFTFGRENPLYQLTGTHLKGEQGHTGLFTRMHDRITGQVQGECCFTHGRTGSEDDQVGCLPAIRYTIQRRETAGYTCYIFIFMTKIFDPLDGIYQNGVNRFKVLTQVIIGDLEQFAFGHIQQVKYIGGILVSIPDDFAADADQFTLNKFLQDDP